MPKVELDAKIIEEWLKDDLTGTFINLVTAIAVILENTDEDIEALETSGLDDTFIERSIRDRKANAYDEMQTALIELV